MHAATPTTRHRASRRAVALALALAAMLTATWLVATARAHASQPAAAVRVAAAPVAPVLGFCRQTGSGDVHNLWLIGPGGTCPAGWSQLTSFPGVGATGPAGPAGPAGPQGPAGPAGVNAIAAHNGVTHTAAGTAGNGVVVVTVTGMPAFSATAARRTFTDLNSELLAAGVTASVGAPTASPGSTTWGWPVTVAGQVAATPAQTVSLDVLAW